MWLQFYSRVNHRSSNNLPHTSVAPVCFVGYEPVVFDQNFGGCVDCASVSSDDAGGVELDISQADVWFAPFLEPIEQFLGGIRLVGLLFFRRSSAIQSVEQVTHRCRPSL